MFRRVGWLVIGLLLVCQWQHEAKVWAQGRERPGRGFGFRGFGPPGRSRGGITTLLRRESVQQELKLTQEQLDKIDQLQGQLRQEMFGMFDLFRRLRSAETDQERQAAQAEVDKARGELRKKAEEALQKILSPEQFQRLKQLELQQRGTRALAEEEQAQALGLSQEQRQKIQQHLDGLEEKQRQLFEGLRDLPRDQRRQRFEALREQIDQLRQQTEQAVLQVLTPEQRAKWQQMLGPPLPEEEGERRPERPRRVELRPLPGGTPGETSGQPPVPPSNRGPGKVILPSGAAGSEPVASFGAPQQEAPAGEQPSGQAPARADASTGQAVRYVSFNFRNAPWSEVLRLLADVTGLTLDLRDEPPGTFSYFDRNRYTPEEAIDVLNGYLLQRGYVLVRRNNFLVVLSVENGIPPNLVPTVPLSELPRRGRNELVSVILPLGELDPEKTAEEVRGLLGPQGKAVPLRSSNALVVTDIASNLLRVQSLIQGATPQAGPDDRVFRSFALRYRPAREAAELLRRLFNLESGIRNVSAGAAESSRGFSSSRSDFFRRMMEARFGVRSRSSSSSSTSRSSTRRSDVSVAVDEWTNSVLVTAPAKEMKVVEQAIRTIDVPNTEQNTTVLGNVRRGTNEPFLRVYQLHSADPREVAKTLGVLHPNNVINEDGRYRRLHIWGTEEEHRRIAEHIRMLDGAVGSSVAVIPLGGINPLTAASLVQSLYASDGQNAPTAVPDPSGTALIVRGDPQQIAQVQMVLRRYGQQAAATPRQRGPVRQFELGQDAARVARLLEQLWRATGSNPIRVVVPSQQGSGAAGASSQPAPRGSIRPSSQQGPPKSQPASEQKSPIDPNTASAAPRVPSLTVSSTVLLQPQPEQGQAAEPDAGSSSDQQEGMPAQEPDAVDAALRELLGEEEPAPMQAPSQPSEKPAPERPAAKPPIVITVDQGRLIISSEDVEALDRLERLLHQLAQTTAPKTRWTVFYLKNSDATEVAAVLEQMLPAGSGTSAAVPGAATLQIIPEARSNALFVTGPPELVRDVEQLLKLLDADELPGQFRDRVPRTIPVRYADVNQVAEILRDVYQDYLQDTTRQESSRRSFFFRSFGSSSSPSSRSGGSNRRVRMTLGVDEQTSQIVVSCSEALFRQVEALVRELDEAARAAQRSVRVVALNNADSAAVQQALVSLFPQVTVSTTAAPGSQATARQGATASSRPGSFDAERAERIRRFFEFLRARRMGMSPGGSPFGSSRSPFSRDRGSGPRPPFLGPPGSFRRPGR